MKTTIKLFTLLLVLGLVSCKDTKKEEETKIMIEQIETIEKEVDSISNSIDKEAKELEDALNELDN